ncbi:MAG: hypothetical protein AAGD07_23165 [Planctomycetota bacterium]
MLAFCALLWVDANTSEAQNFGFGQPDPGGQYPSQAYYNALQIYRDGDLENALDAVDIARRGTRTDINGKWLDSIPVLALMAECHWQLGNLDVCRATIDEALRIVIRHRGWLGQLDYGVLVRPGVASAGSSNLWPAAAAVVRIPITDRVPMRSGEVLTEQRLAQGGVIETPNIRVLDAVEVMRAIASLCHRRRVLLGPLSDQDPLVSEALEATKYPAGLVQPVGRAAIGSMRAAGYLAVMEDATVVDRMTKHAAVGQGVHPLAPLLLLSGMRALIMGDAAGQIDAAAKDRLVQTAQEVANSAAALRQYEWIGPAFQLAAGVATEQRALAVRSGAVVAATTLVRQSRLASLHCYLVAADASLTLGDVVVAEQHLRAATEIASRRDVMQPRLEAYGAYLAARIATMQGDRLGDGSDSALAQAMTSMNRFVQGPRIRNRSLVAMPWSYQLGLVSQSLTRSMGNQSAAKLAHRFVNGAEAWRWRADPVDALASCLDDHTFLNQTLLNLALSAQTPADVVRYVDRVLADRFLMRLPLHGRLLQWRSLATLENLDDHGWKEIEASAPATFKRLRGDIAATSNAPGALDPNADPTPLDAKQAATGEAILSQLALSRGLVPAVNPPPLGDNDGAAMPEKTALVTFTFHGTRCIGTLTHRNGSTLWQVGAARGLPGMVGKLLASIGVSRSRGARLDAAPQWETDAVRLMELLFPAVADFDPRAFEKVIVVPDGPLWYLPFETLPAGPDGQIWADVTGVAYAPTPGFALRNVGRKNPGNRSLMVTAPFFAPRELEINAALSEQVASGLDNPIVIPLENGFSGANVGLPVAHVLVASVITPSLQDPMATAVAAGPGNRWKDFVRLPATSPHSLLLPGFRTTATSTKPGDGSELFFALAALRSAGTDGILLTRWVTGGASAATFLEELMAELPHAPLGEAVMRARLVLRQSELSVADEPLLGKLDEDIGAITGDRPLFWAGYLSTDNMALPPIKSDAGNQNQ